jgi:hypothetical protein
MMSVDATLKWNEKARINLQQAPEKVMRSIARQTLDYTGSSKVTAYDTGKTERSMYAQGVQGDMDTGFYIGNFTDYAMYVYPKSNVAWTNPNTQTRWFEFIWRTKGTGIIDRAIKECKL